MCYSVQPRDRIFVKGYGFLSFAKNMGKNIGRNVSKSLTGKYSQKFLDHVQIFATDALKITSKGVAQKKQLSLMTVELKKFKKIHNKII